MAFTRIEIPRAANRMRPMAETVGTSGPLVRFASLANDLPSGPAGACAAGV